MSWTWIAATEIDASLRRELHATELPGKIDDLDNRLIYRGLVAHIKRDTPTRSNRDHPADFAHPDRAWYGEGDRSGAATTTQTSITFRGRIAESAWSAVPGSLPARFSRPLAE